MGCQFSYLENQIFSWCDEMSEKVLRLGWKTIGYQLGTGIYSGWGMVQSWLKDLNLDNVQWKDDRRVCCECGGKLMFYSVPAPVWVTIWKCENGHRFCYENTD